MRVFQACLALALASLLVATERSPWRGAGIGLLRNVSGAAAVDRAGDALTLLIVHDNKLPHQARLGRLVLDGGTTYTRLEWPSGAQVPVDLEAIVAMPGSRERFLTLASSGTVTVLHVLGSTVSVLGSLTLPNRPERADFEGLAVQRLDGRLVLAWSHRGAGADPGVLFWGVLDDSALTVSLAGRSALRVPDPDPADPRTRHVSDLRLAPSGEVWLSSSWDAGDSGPFRSAVYRAGHLQMRDGLVEFAPAVPPSQVMVSTRKIEAIELLDGPSRLLLGTDDENLGGSITLLPLP